MEDYDITLAMGVYSYTVNDQLTHLIDCILQSTSPMEWCDLFLNGCICALCEAFYIRRCWKV